jgi:hypothetical protein
MRNKIIELSPSRIIQVAKHICNLNFKNNGPNLVMSVIGKHGFGKTSLFRELAASEGWKFKELPVGQISEMGDMHGLPYEKEDGTTGYRAPDWAPQEEGPGIFLLDDFTRADPRIQNGIMQLIQDSKLMSWSIPKGWTIVLTENPSEDDEANYSVTELDPAQRTRFARFKIKFDKDEWIDWLLSKNYHPAGIAFFSLHIHLLNGETTDPIDVPRTAEYFLRALDDMDLNETHNQILSEYLIGGYMSNIARNTWLNFLSTKEYDIPDPKTIFSVKTVEESIKLIQEASRDKSNNNLYRAEIVKIILLRCFNYYKSLIIKNQENSKEVDNKKLLETGNRLMNILYRSDNKIIGADMATLISNKATQDEVTRRRVTELMANSEIANLVKTKKAI